MARGRDVNRIIQAAKFDDQCRTLVLIDEFGGGVVAWCRFVHRYDGNDSFGVGPLFAETFNRLAVSPEGQVFTENTLPILKHSGRYKITVITRISPTEVKISNGESRLAESYMGLGS